MLDLILKSKFYTRCKSEIKLTLKRIEMIKRKRNAMQKFLRNDVADLLKNGLDSNSFGRVEQLYADQKLSWCYEFVEQSCLLILSHLSTIDKQRECPEECKEAISTLMFAAARFADLPELRELRSSFAERYGNYLEPYVNQEFVKNLKADPPTKEIKLQMMQEIATESGIRWDSKALEQKLYKPPSFVQDWSQYTNERNHESLGAGHQNGPETYTQETEKKNKETEITKDHPRKNVLPYKSRDEVEKKEEEKHKDPPVKNCLPYKSRAEVETKKEEIHDNDRVSPYWSSNTSSCSESMTSPEYSTGPDDSASEDTPEERKFYAFRSMAPPPPPYIKTESTKTSTASDTCISGREDASVDSDIPKGRKINGLRSMGPPYIKTDISKKTVGSNFQSEEETENISKPVPRSVRIRRPLKPVTGCCRGNSEVSKPSPQFSNGENHDHDHDHRDGEKEEEEKKMDKLLSHYSRKASQIPAPTRTGSLPPESVVTTEERKGLARAATYHADSGLSSRGGHVHPKLPDYDDFVARLAAFRASS